MDVHSPERRSFNMSRIRGTNTHPELIVRKFLWRGGFRYRLHGKFLPGKPDIVFPGRKKVIFVHGCFWHHHSCRYFKWPESNAVFWKEKISANVKRDKMNYKRLSNSGWNYIIIWECETKAQDLEKLWLKIREFLNS